MKRPVSHDYRAELERRFQSRSHLCEMSMVGMSADTRKPYECAEGIAIINISGVLTNGAEWDDETDYCDIQNEVMQASADADVKGILLRINSPGGDTENAFETALVLRAAAKTKPMWCVADSSAYSAGYLLASCAERIYVPPVTGGVGSIGVYCGHMDVSGALEKAGVKVTLISAGKGKTDGNPYEPLSDAAKARIQGEVNRLYDAFVASVAIGRETSTEALKKMGAVTFKGAAAAIGAGLADASGTVEQAWFDLAQRVAKKDPSMVASASMTSLKEVPKMESTETKVADTTTQVVDIEATKAQGYADAAAIVNLCLIAGKSLAVANGFIDKKMTTKQVGDTLLAEIATATAAELETVAAVAVQGQSSAKPWGEVMASIEGRKGGK